MEERVEDGGEGGMEGGGGGSASARFARGADAGESPASDGVEWPRFAARSSSIRCCCCGEGGGCRDSDGGGGGGGSCGGGGSGGGGSRAKFAHRLNVVASQWRVAARKSLSRAALRSLRREIATLLTPLLSAVGSTTSGLGFCCTLEWLRVHTTPYSVTE